MMKLKIINYFYYNTDESSILCWCCRNKEGEFHLVQIKDEQLRPFMGVLKEEWEKFDTSKIKYEILKSEKGPDSLFDEEVVYIYMQFPWQVGRVRNTRICKKCGSILWRKDRKYHCNLCKEDFWKKDTNSYFSQTFIADVKWEKMAMSKIIKICGLQGPFVEIPDDYMYKYLTLDDIQPTEEFLVNYRICYYDIESDARHILPKSKYEDYKEMPILSITCYDNYENVYTEFVWHPEFENTIYREFENRKIRQGEKEIIIDKIYRWECTSESIMFSKFFEYFSQKRFDILFSYFGEGGYKKQGGRRIWINGFDTPAVYARTEQLQLLEEIQKMSPCPILKKANSDNYEGVYLRKGRGEKRQIVIKGVAQIDYVFTDEVFNFSRKHYDFRGGRLEDWMGFFLDFPKVDKENRRVWEYWEQEDLKNEN